MYEYLICIMAFAFFVNYPLNVCYFIAFHNSLKYMYLTKHKTTSIHVLEKKQKHNIYIPRTYEHLSFVN